MGVEGLSSKHIKKSKREPLKNEIFHKKSKMPNNIVLERFFSLKKKENQNRSRMCCKGFLLTRSNPSHTVLMPLHI